MDISRVASLVDEIILLGRMKTKLIASKEFKNLKLTHAEVYICRIILLLFKELKRDKIPIALLFKIVLSLETSISRTVSSLEEKGYIKRLYERAKKGRRRRIYIKVTPKGEKIAILLAKYDQQRLEETIKNFLEHKLMDKMSMDKPFILGANLALRSLQRMLVDEVRKEELKL